MELETYKKNRINELKKTYSNKISLLQKELRNAINAIQHKRLFSNIKKNQINRLTTTYSSYANTLTRQLNNDILSIKNYLPVEPSIVNKKALLVGINYTNTQNELYGCINDVSNVKDRLNSQGFIVTTLTDFTEKKPTKKNIIDEFTSLIMNSTSGDLLFFMYSGHGSNILDKNGDEKDRYDEMLVSGDLKAILDDELKTLINQYLNKDVTLFCMFDSCFSGTVLDLKYQFLDSLNYDKYTENSNTTSTLGNVYMISGCTDNQTSADAFINNKPQGAMTWALLESIKSNITWRELIKSMRDKLKSSGYEQVPQFSSGNFVDIDSIVFI